MYSVWNNYKYLAIVIVLIAAIAASFVFGYKIRGWHDDSVAVGQAKKDFSDMQADVAKIIATSDENTKLLTQLNQQTEASSSELIKQLGDQNDAFMHLQSGLKGTKVGGCNFTSDSDGLYLRAYQAAMPDSNSKNPTKGKAGGGHAGH